ncbi:MULTISPECIES: molybdopterin-guanine dinucleotide biosynthesis protein B [unclassified Halomonas]|uniref:molybdopterin-guanine dinucleotide biosynthesis protein B n=1 Tax=unclassified Halomonas TaxID=2609666 RepID=UPI001CF28A0F|nr:MULTISPECIES: molybdopterin-guanine dinucleotide biosynthesis protein B [unclassified Halomonas]MCA8866513.1 molybdopterin-guanine dinucleotide biosynthesis protein B [Halomonas sp. SBBP1]UZH08131.1 molybdopterin-guanine dinucleotide biosynthesis protein B [Halomonas sp. BDJS001]
MENELTAPFPILGVAAWSGTGKTTLLEKLLPRLGEYGLKVAVIKHAHHSFDVDQPGKDSYKLRSAGAAPVLVASRQRFALMQETPGQDEPDLAELIAMVVPHHPDLLIVEGFKAWPIPKLVLYRDGIGDPAILSDRWVEAAALSAPPPIDLAASVAQLDLDDSEAIARWIVSWVSAKNDAIFSSAWASKKER